jgi:mono/diheme cytochrome c family protein
VIRKFRRHCSIVAIAAAIACTAGCGGSAAPAAQTARQAFGWIDAERLAKNDSSQWLTTGNDVGMSHYSALQQPQAHLPFFDGRALLAAHGVQRTLTARLYSGARGGPLPPLLPPLPPIPEPPAETASAELVARGRDLFEANCSACHFNRPRGYPPDLHRLDRAKHDLFRKIVLEGLLRPNGMPQWDDVLSPADVDAIHAYIVSISWDAFRAEHEHAPAPMRTQPLNVH